MNWTDNLITKNVLCYSHYDFDNIMKHNGWIDDVPPGISCVSISEQDEFCLPEHWFKNSNERIFNLDIADGGPFWFNDNEYDKALDLYINGDITLSNAYFVHDLQHVLNYNEAVKLVKFIDNRIKQDDIMYIHCAAGVSRSQGVVRYILDTYGHIYNIKINPANPCLTPNSHVVLMLKRAYRILNQ